MKLLAIETAEDACSAALYLDGAITSRFEIAPRQHSKLILPMMDALLDEADVTLASLDGLAFGRGPGSFTGVRIAASVIQGAAFGADLPVAPVSTLAALAQGAIREHGAQRVLTALDARMGEVYWAAYRSDQQGVAQPVDKERVIKPGDAPLAVGTGWFGVGSGWRTYAAELTVCQGAAVESSLPELRIHAYDVATLGSDILASGGGVAAKRAVPVYLRNEVAWKKTTEQARR